MKRIFLIATLALLTACGGGEPDTTVAPQTTSFIASEARMKKLAFTPATQNELYQFFAVAFGSAPGVTYMAQLNEAANAGLPTQEIVNIFTTKSQFTEVYPTTLSSTEFADKLVNAVVGSSATDQAKASAVDDVVSALALPGWTRGDVIFAIFTNLASKPSSDPDWAGTSKKMANQVIYARYYTEVMKGDTTDLHTLQKVIAGVTAGSDTSSGVEQSITTALSNVPPVVNAGGTGVPVGADSANSDNLDLAPGTGFITSSTTTYCGVAVPAKSITGVVTSVYDGDTIKIGSTNIRLDGIDAPELAQAYGIQSRDDLRSLVNGQTVTVYYSKIDKYGRTVGSVFNNSCVNVNLQQVRTGSAWHYKQYQCEQSAGMRSEFAVAQTAAEMSKRGLWTFSATSPWVYRNGTDPAPPKCSSDNPSWYTATTSVPVTPVTTVTPPSAGTGTASPVTPVIGCREVWVNGYTRKNGTKVRGHYRTIC